MILNFLVPSTPHPVGGVMAILEFANGMARRGHEIHVSHLQFVDDRADSLADLSWCRLDPRLHHHFPRPLVEADLPEGDFVFCFDERQPARAGLPLMWIQAYKILPEEIEAKIYGAPCPKLCTSWWLTELAAEIGPPGQPCLHLPYGLDHDKYRVRTPIASRPQTIAMLYNSHPVKGARYGLDAIEMAMDRVPGVNAVVFGTTEVAHRIPDGVTYRASPEQADLVDEIYNGSAVFLSSSPLEGFGLAAVEAMASGCALVTAANQGAADYAFPGETALVAPAHDAAGLAAHLEALLVDPAARIAMAQRGHDFAHTFDWDRSAERLEGFLLEYRADPASFQGIGSAAI